MNKFQSEASWEDISSEVELIIDDLRNMRSDYEFEFSPSDARKLVNKFVDKLRAADRQKLEAQAQRIYQLEKLVLDMTHRCAEQVRATEAAEAKADRLESELDGAKLDAKCAWQKVKELENVLIELSDAEHWGTFKAKIASLESELADLKAAGGPPFIRSEAIRNLKADLDSAKQKLAKLEEEYPWRLAQDHGLIELLEKDKRELTALLATARDALKAYRFAYIPDGHVSPHDCFATGPLTGDPISDFVVCPGCAAEKLYAQLTAALKETK